MKESKKEVIKSVLILADSVGIKDNASALIKNFGLHSTIREIVYKLFVENKTDDDSIYEAYQMVRRYCIELAKNGEVNFEK